MIFEVSEGWTIVIFDVPKRRRRRRPRYGRSDRRKIVKKMVLAPLLRRLPGDPAGTVFGRYGRDFGDVFWDPEQNRRFSENHGFPMAGA